MIAPNAILAARKAHGLTQLQVAVRCGVAYQTYRLWEGGGTKPGPENEKRLREVLEIEEEEDTPNGDDPAQG